VDQLVVQLRVVREVAVFLELLAVVAGDDDRGLVGDPGRLKRVEQAPDAGVDLSHRGLVEGSEVAEGPLADLPAEARARVGVEHPVGADQPVGDLADVPRGGTYGVWVSM